MSEKVKPYSEDERLKHEFIFQYLIVCANPEDTSITIDIKQREYEVV